MSALIDIKEGDSVWCGTDSLLAAPSFEKVMDISMMASPEGELFEGIKLYDGHTFNKSTGKAVTPPLNYYIMKL